MGLLAIPHLLRRLLGLGLSSPVVAPRLIKPMGSVRGDMDPTHCLAPVLRRPIRDPKENKYSDESRVDYEMATTASV